MQLDGKLALVTGGGRGLGLALAQSLSSHGAELLLTGRHERPLLDAAAQLPATTTIVVADVGTREGRAQMVRAATSRGVDLLINNAGVQVNRNWLDSQPSELEAVIRHEVATNLEGPLALTAALLPSLAQRPEAAVVNITSGLALAPKASAPVYSATKAALRTATRALRYQMQDAGLPLQFVDVVLPMVDTDMTRGRGARKARPEDVADCIVRGLINGEEEIWVGQARLLKHLMRLAPPLGYRALRGSPAIGED